MRWRHGGCEWRWAFDEDKDEEGREGKETEGFIATGVGMREGFDFNVWFLTSSGLSYPYYHKFPHPIAKYISFR